MNVRRETWGERDLKLGPERAREVKKGNYNKATMRFCDCDPAILWRFLQR